MEIKIKEMDKIFHIEFYLLIDGKLVFHSEKREESE